MRNTNNIFGTDNPEEMIPDSATNQGEIADENHLNKWFKGLRGDIEMQNDGVPGSATIDAMPSADLYKAADAALIQGDLATRTALLEEARKRDDEWGRMADITLKIVELRQLVEAAKEQ